MHDMASLKPEKSVLWKVEPHSLTHNALQALQSFHYFIFTQRIFFHVIIEIDPFVMMPVLIMAMM